MIAVNELSMHFGKQVLFENASFQLNPGGRYGLVGANGSGKSTLLKILSGQIKPEEGEVSMPSELRLGLLKQDHFEYEEHRIMDVVLMGRQELWHAMKEKDALTASGEITEAIGHRLGELEMIIADQDGYMAEPQAAELLAGLGVPDYEKPLKTLSGGYKLRVLLAQCLFGRPDFLALDEPTNHLDLASITWLEGYLSQFEGTFLIISHDRHFLNGICNHIVDVDYEEIRVYAGNYDRFVAAKKLEREQKESEIERQEKKKEEMQAFVDRFKAKASKARQAGSKAKQIEKMEEIVIKRSSRIHPKIRFEINRPSGKEALQLKEISKSFGEKSVIKKTSLKLQRGERLAVIGPNGIGKSTLLKIIVGQLTPDQGEMILGHESQIGYFPQDHHEQIPKNTTPYEWLYSFEPTATIGQIRSLLARVLLTDEDVHKSTGSISGGEAARLIIARLMLQKPNLLLIDEPTNHMDIESIESLTDALKAYPGTVICVSHDRRFIEAIATQVLELTHEGFLHFAGGYLEFVEKEGQDYLDRAAQSPQSARPVTPVEPQAAKPKTGSQDAFNARKDANRMKKGVRNKESKISSLEKEIKAIEAKLAEGTLYKPPFKKELAEALAQKEELTKGIEKATQEWEEAQAKFDELIAKFPELSDLKGE